MKAYVYLPLALAITGGLAVPALAQSAEKNWTGPYVGGQLGYSFQPSDRGESVLFDTNRDGSFGDTVNTIGGLNAFSQGFCGGAANGALPASGCRSDKDGTDWKVHAGYDIQFGNIVAGVVGEYGRADITDSVSAYSTTPAFYTMTRRLRDNAGLRARLGYDFGGTLIYGTGGGAWGKVRNSFTTSNVTNAFTTNGNDDAWGYKYGGGIEQKIGDHFSVGAQYMFTSLKDDGYRVTAAPGTALPSNPFLLVDPTGTDFRRSGDKFETHTVSVTANYRF